MSHVSILDLSGPVKWFDVAKGFGFVVSPMGDVLVHHSVLREFGTRSVPEGATLELQAFEGERGLKAIRVMSIDMAGAVSPRPKAKRWSQQQTGEAGPFELLEVKWFDDDLGYGFLIRDEDDVFLHAQTAEAGGLRRAVSKGMWIDARVAQGEKGLIATEVRAHREQLAA